MCCGRLVNNLVEEHRALREVVVAAGLVPAPHDTKGSDTDQSQTKRVSGRENERWTKRGSRGREGSDVPLHVARGLVGVGCGGVDGLRAAEAVGEVVRGAAGVAVDLSRQEGVGLPREV